MSPGNIDWSVMRGSVALFVIAVLIGAGVIGSALYFTDRVDREFSRQKRELASIRSRYQTVDEERDLVDTYMPLFEQLETRGIIGEELRLNWIESLRETGRRYRIPSLRYAIEKQSQFDPVFELATGPYRLYGSRMELTLGLLHEEDLVRVLRDLERRAAGLFRVEECELERNGEQITEDPKAENVRGRCALRWLTLKKPEADA